MQRVVVLGRGGAGKSILAAQLGAVTSLPVVELDRSFWLPDLIPMRREQWTEVQRELVAGQRWILDGDLSTFDVLDVRLSRADTVIVLDFPLWICAWRAARRGRESLTFWRWVVTYRRSGLPMVKAAIAAHASDADVHVLRNPGDTRHFLALPA